MDHVGRRAMWHHAGMNGHLPWRNGFTLALAVAVASCAPVATQTKTETADPGEEVRTLVLGLAAAIEKGDIAALDRLYSDDPNLLIIEGAGADRGWQRYRDHHLEPELAEAKDLRYRYSNLRVDVAGGLAWATFDYELRATIKETPLDIAGKGTLILRRTAGAWKIVHSHTSGKPKK